MPAETTAVAAPGRSGAATRARILAVANDLFYAHGIRATSADRIIDEVGITKVTFYRHFRTKSDLVVAYLEQQAAAERAWIESVRREGDPVGSLRSLATDIGAASCQPGFRGCAFINAAAEFSDPDDPVRSAVDAHRRWMLDVFAELASQAGADDVDAIAKQLMMLRDGAMVNGYLNDPASVAGSLGAAFASILVKATSTD
ncbi:transcriptional regulator, TetR family [Nocardioides terrae]|uniref:Transcriptional regulator, TetR family n=1 Tax=Nocardioides terrae TaxID=574651 RepID=A0A1I1DT85_9ACTN|nr:TetR/AcrR family transcriptional regulator [Nocardioides terrae]SFB75940.1 transcriptional regulator, TetR family [Nocardioides terrae]